MLLVLETDNRDMYKYTDTDGDGVADKKELFYAGAGRVTNMEWQPGGLTWALDNWLYMTYNPYRLRIAPDGKLLREETEPNGGQWWSAQDDYGKMWWVDGGGEIGPVNIQAPIAYGAFNVADNFEPDFQVPVPGARRHRRHAGRHEPRPAAGRHAQSLHRRLRRRDLPRRSPAEGHASAISSSTSRSAASSAARRSSSPTG